MARHVFFEATAVDFEGSHKYGSFDRPRNKDPDIYFLSISNQIYLYSTTSASLTKAGDQREACEREVLVGIIAEGEAPMEAALEGPQIHRSEFR